ncbi:S1/P1 nuclease [Rapidithrix thailandica]|uniref:S1/P1 nuclease n=1 Tax=Rapidithrix thailandica TaxID=413964 RepID=A0AAW9SBQ1_9BACT
MKVVSFCIAILFSSQLLAHDILWGQTGHRVVGLVAEKHLSKKAKKNIRKVLQEETLAMASNWMDFIKSNPEYDFMKPWHYATIPDGKTYEEAGTPEEGDVIVTIQRLVKELKSKQFSHGDEKMALRCLIHLVGDIHQPLHVGNGTDKGGNDVRLEYFWNSSNLHRVWDSGIIDKQQLSFTEYVESINHTSKEQVQTWQSSTVVDWAYESMKYRQQIYELPENNKINYRYNYEHLDSINLRLLQAGVRLAGLLNEIYG